MQNYNKKLCQKIERNENMQNKLSVVYLGT